MKQTALPLSQALRAKLIDECIAGIVFNMQEAIQSMRLAKVEKYVRNCQQTNGGVVQVVVDRSKAKKITVTFKSIDGVKP